MNTDLSTFFSPKTIAVIGASRKKGSLGRMLIEKLVHYGYEGAIYPVNPKASSICGLPVSSSIDDLPDAIDLAVILIPKHIVNETMKIIGKKGIKNCIVITAGFKEVGGAGIEREQELIKISKKYDIRFIGPNCMGIINTDPEVRMNCSFSPTEPYRGNIAFISQSGALGVAVLEMAKEIHLGFSLFASTGNKADLKDVDFLRSCENDEKTDVIVFYFESIENTAEFHRLAKKISKKKPILAIKAGRTASGAAAASSHTGALASRDAVSDAFLRACGIIRADSVQEMFDMSQAFASQPLLKGKRIAVLTNAGGPAIMATDAIEQNKLEIAKISKESKIQLRSFLPEEASVKNPVDMIASARHDTYRQAAEILLLDENTDALMIIIVRPPVDTTPKQIAKELSDIRVKYPDKPILCVVMAQADKDVDLAYFRRQNLPVYQYPENAAKTLSKMQQYYLSMEDDQVESVKDLPVEKIMKIIELARVEKRENLKQTETFEIFSLMGLPVPHYDLVKNKQDAIRFWQKLGKPIVMKIEANEIQHKSDIGAVKININSKSEIEQAWQEIISSAKKVTKDIDGIFVQEMVAMGTEIAIGLFDDSNFGKMLMFGLGGIYVEVLKDVAFWPTDISSSEAIKLIDSLKYKQLLEGARGKAVADKKWLAGIIQRIGLLGKHVDDIAEMDINPFSINTDDSDSLILDGRIRIKI